MAERHACLGQMASEGFEDMRSPATLSFLGEAFGIVSANEDKSRSQTWNGKNSLGLNMLK